VSLQGEGEPTLHPDFFLMADEVRAIGSRPYTITNGSYRRPEHFIGRFPEVGLSIDTLDEGAANEIGRYNLPRVLAFAEALRLHLTVVVHSVAHQPHTAKVAAWCEAYGLPHIIQPLQPKADYASRYPSLVAGTPSVRRFSCRHLSQPFMRYFALDGTEMPCCYIKDTATYPGLAVMHEHQRSGTWPTSCIGCRFGSVRGEDAASPG
jgi:hypothetical protein